MRALRIIFKTLALFQWLAACGVALFATVTAVDFFDQFGGQEAPPIGAEAGILLAQLLILTGYVLALFLCLSAIYCDKAVASRDARLPREKPLAAGESRED